ncbi:MAG: Rrf2 family transcriptional regulator [Clostridia bacterium]|nr:Rrf2 family transcriptional regulator [Clostridia bacterium]
MFLNNETDYAIRIVSCLAEQSGRLDAASIAQHTGVTQRFTLKILHRLVLGGIVRSFKGNKGGYVLARPAKEITLLEVVEEIYGPLTLNRCLDNGECGCTHPNGFCDFKDVFSDVTTYIRCKLSHVTFEHRSAKEIKD